MAAASTLAVPRASDPGQGVVADQDGLGRAHGQRGAQARGLPVGGHRHQGHLAPAGGIGELEGHLDAVGVGVVEDEFSLADKVLGPRVQRRRGGRIGDLLHTDNDVHGRALLSKTDPSTNRARESQVRTPALGGHRPPPPRPLGPAVGRARWPARATSSVITVSTPACSAARRRVVHRPGGDEARPRGPRPTRPHDQVDVGVEGRAAEAGGGSHAGGRIEPRPRNPVASRGAAARARRGCPARRRRPRPMPRRRRRRPARRPPPRGRRGRSRARRAGS